MRRSDRPNRLRQPLPARRPRRPAANVRRSTTPVTRKLIDVVDLLVAGYTYDEAAMRLECAESTLKSRVRYALQGVGVSSTAELVDWLWRHGYMGQVVVDLDSEVPRIAAAILAPERFAAREAGEPDAMWRARAVSTSLTIASEQ